MILEHNVFGKRLVLSAAVVSLAFLTIILRLYYLQGVKGEYFRDLSENNRRRMVRTSAPRGIIYDREGRPLVKNRPAFDVAVILEDVPKLDLLLEKLASLTGRSVASLQAQLKKDSRKHHPFEPKVLIPDITREELAMVRVHSYELPGVIINVTPQRIYPYQNLAAQLFGYTREISKTQLEDEIYRGYQVGDLVGQQGLEKTWEKSLRGKSGFVYVEVDAHGNRRGELGAVDNTPGADLYLTIDADLQIAAEQALGVEKGAVVMLDVNSGEVLTLASTPTFDANLLSGNINQAEWRHVQTDKAKPLLNRALLAFHPGSTFKLFTGFAGLAEKVINSSHTYYCPGFYAFKGRRYRCHKHSGHGNPDLRMAITASCDSYFYQLGLVLGIERIHQYATMFGMGAKTEIDLPGEKAGIIPSESWKLKNLGERWYQGETLSVVIGQGYVSATPLQMALATATLANGGTVYKPHLVTKVIRQQQNSIPESTLKEVRPEVIRKIEVAPQIFDQIKSFAESVVIDPHGTGHKAQIQGLRIGGKTGTAQVASLGKEHLGKEFQDHAWFVAFAPVDNPQVAIAVLVENGGHGGAAAAPVAQKVLEKYFVKKGMITTPTAGPDPSLEQAAPVTEEHLSD
ncbi:penicillin-binding protein 2 [bacterium]|nr:penicillin-binding protein 2 [bacterium]